MLRVVGLVIFAAVLSTGSVAYAAAPDCSGYPAAYTGAGTSGDPYQVSDLAGLQCMSRSLGSYYVLTADIDASDTSTWNSGAGFEPIGTDSGTPFQGGFDGNNHVVANLRIDRPSTSYVGLFGYMSSSAKYLRNLGLVNAYVRGGYMTGGMAGILDTPSDKPVSNCFVTGSVIGGASNSEVGGFAADSRADIVNSYVQASVVTQNYHGAGFVGQNRNVAITDSYFSGTVTKTGGATLAAFVYKDEGTTGKIGNVFYDSDKASGLSACNSGCSDDTITGKPTSAMQSVSTYTDLDTSGLSSAWDFVGNPNDDAATNNYWTISDGAAPALATFLGLADQDGDGYDQMHDCDDTNASAHAVATFYIDGDDDGFGAASTTTESCGAPEGYSATSDDCDDTDAGIYPHFFYLDSDSDGYGDPSSSTSVCGGSSTTA
ncbi:MAG: hypothetical protein HGA38_05705, partial [Candidatus Moranbacteria bacterium]|nr:hypothetical protein [Candidatus Moranbacteria bacterium]